MRWALGLAALLWAGFALAQGLEDAEGERQQLQDRLLLERAALATLKDRQSGILELIDLLEQQGRQSAVRASTTQKELGALQRRREQVLRQTEQSQLLVARQVEEVSPRLKAMYRLQRLGRLEVLLSASDFGALVWRARALGTLVEGDLQLLSRLRGALLFQERSAALAERLSTALSQRAEQLALERELARQQQALLGELLAQVGADTRLSSRLVRELEQAERRLSRLVENLGFEVERTAFASKKGQLPWPVSGTIEVSFGKILNPRFNTVTFQKGLDLRSPAGNPVRAVGEGTVVHAGWLKGYGNILIIDHGSGYHSLMAHLQGFRRSVGDEVVPGDLLGMVGDTGSLKGAYLYFELRKNGIAIDPKHWLGAPDF